MRGEKTPSGAQGRVCRAACSVPQQTRARNPAYCAARSPCPSERGGETLHIARLARLAACRVRVPTEKRPVGLRGGYIARLALCLSKPGLETLHIARLARLAAGRVGLPTGAGSRDLPHLEGGGIKSPVGLRGGYIVRLAFCLSKPGLETLHIARLARLERVRWEVPTGRAHRPAALGKRNKNKTTVGLRGGYIARLALCLSKPGLETLHIARLARYGGKFLPWEVPLPERSGRGSPACCAARSGGSP